MHIKLRNGLSHIVWCFVQRKYNHLDGYGNILYSVGHLFAWVSVALAGLFSFFYLRVPRVPYRALPLFHPGLCRSAALAGLFSFFYLCLPRVPYRALPLFHPGLCRSAALTGLIVGLSVFTQGFISGFALIPPWAMQECRPCDMHPKS